MLSRPEVILIDRCLSCGSGQLQPILSFGETPVADHLLNENDLTQEDLQVPLDLRYCQQCRLVQLGQSLDPAWMFDVSYPYFSSVTSSLLEHSRKHVEELIESQHLVTGSTDQLVVEIASNDGYLLQYFNQGSIPVLGIEPCSRQAQQARDKGVETVGEFFTHKLALSLVEQGRQASVIIANNVLAHVPGLNDFVAGMSCLLRDNGLISIEVPYVVDLVDKLEFDTIYHQHLCYFSVIALDQLFRRHNLYINHVNRFSTLGGSLRLNIGKQESVDESVAQLLHREKETGATGPEYYFDFANRLDDWKRQLVLLLTSLAEDGKRVVAYGAAAKGTMLLSYCGLDHHNVEYVVDRNEHKQGFYLPGSRLLVRPVETLIEDQPDYVLMLVWNIKDEVLAQQSEFRQRGGKFIIPIPELMVV